MPKKDPCSKLAATITKLALNIGEREGMDTIDKVVGELQKHIPEINRDSVVSSIVEATTGYERAASEVSDRLNAIKREARSEATIRKKIAEIEKNLKAGTLPARADRPDRATEAIKGLRELRAEAQAKLRQSEPARMERVLKSIEDLTDRLEEGVYVPKAKGPEAPVSKQLERAMYERDRLKAQVRQQLESLKPRSVLSKVAEPFNFVRAVMTSYDISAPFRQGAVLTFSHPVRAARAFGPMLRSLVSAEYAHKVNTEIMNRPNAPLYARSKLYLAPDEVGHTLSKQEEAFMSRLAVRIPGVKGSQRAYVTFLNKIRADTFDSMVSTLSRNGEATGDEAALIANYVNVATGRGSLGGAEKWAEGFNAAFFAPRYVSSRFQFLAGQPLWAKPGTAAHTLAVRKLLAKEYARFAAGVGTFMAMGALAGGTIETDPRSSDFAKIRFGKTRIDPWAGLQQVAVLGSRIGSNQTKTAKGEVKTLGKKFGDPTGLEIAGRFARSKLSPLGGFVADALDREDYVGEPLTVGGQAQKLLIPMSLQNLPKLMEDQGLNRGTALQMLNMMGMGVQTYE